MGLGPIPGSAIRAFAHENAITGDWLDSFIAIIRAMDGEYLKLLAPKEPGQASVVRGDDVDGIKAVLSRASKGQAS